MRASHGNSFLHFALAQSIRHRESLLERPLSQEIASRYEQMAETSRAEQQRIEASDDVPFEQYRQRYLITFTPTMPAGPGWHRLDVSLRNRPGTVVAREGYVARAQ